MTFHRRSLRSAVEMEGGTFDGTYHVDGWGASAAGNGDRPEPPAPLNCRRGFVSTPPQCVT